MLLGPPLSVTLRSYLLLSISHHSVRTNARSPPQEVLYDLPSTVLSPPPQKPQGKKPGTIFITLTTLYDGYLCKCLISPILLHLDIFSYTLKEAPKYMCALMIVKYIPSDAFIYLHSPLCVYTCQNKDEKATFFIVNFIDLLYIHQCIQQIVIVCQLPTHPVCTCLLALDTC